MLEKTNLEECKRVAKEILDNAKPIILKETYSKEKIHPFILEIFGNIDFRQSEKHIERLKKYNASIVEIYKANNMLNRIQFEIPFNYPVNVFEDDGAYILAKYGCKEIVDEIKEYKEFGYWIRYPFTLDFLEKTINFISMKDFCKYLMEIWVHIDETLQIFRIKTLVYIEKQQERFRKYFKEANKKELMDKEEFKIFSELDEIVTVYRGLTEENKNNIKGLSWTMNKDIAQYQFATALEPKGGYVYKAKINKNDIFAFCNQRKEEELIVDYTKLYDIELLND